jgi:hypothetical protein
MLQPRTKRLVVLLERNPLRQPSTDENAVQSRVPSLLELCMREMLNSRPWAPRDMDAPPSGPSLHVSLQPGGSRLNTPGRPLTQSSLARPTTADDAALESKARRSWIERQPLSSHVKRRLTMADHCASCNRCGIGRKGRASCLGVVGFLTCVNVPRVTMTRLRSRIVRIGGMLRPTSTASSFATYEVRAVFEWRAWIRCPSASAYAL